MFKPNKQLREILVACVKSEHLQRVNERLVESVFVYVNDDGLFSIKPEESVTGKYINIEVDKTNFDKVLECGRWYPSELFDGNPCDYILLEINSDGFVDSSSIDLNTFLHNTTEYFMYVKKP